MLERRLWEMAAERAVGRDVSRVVRGLRYTGALLDGGETGLALSEGHSLSVGGRGDERATELLLDLPRAAADLLALSSSGVLSDRAVAVAVANALLGVEGEDSEALPPIAPGSRLVMVGNIKPVARELRREGFELSVFDRREQPELRAEETVRQVAGADLALLTASTVANGTWTELVAAARRCWIIGPSAPMNAALYQGTSVELVLGRRVVDSERLLAYLAAGAGTRQWRDATVKVLLRLIP